MGIDKILSRVIEMSGMATVVILAVLLVRILFKRLPKVYSYILWSVVLLRLLCPISITSNVSAFNLLNYLSENIQMGNMQTGELSMEAGELSAGITEGNVADGTESDAAISGLVLPEADVEGALKTDGTPAIPDSTLAEMAVPKQLSENALHASSGEGHPIVGANGWGTIAVVIWLLGMLAMLFYSVISLMRLKKQLVGSLQIEDNIYLSDYIKSPFVLGVLRPRIYLPSVLQEKEKDYILLHERIHIRRGDHIFRMLAFGALSIHWFNPFVWLAFYLSGVDMEMSCDDAVMKKKGADIRTEYSTSLLSLATGKQYFQGTLLAFGEGNVKNRVKNVMKYKKPAVITAVVAVSVVIVLICTMGSNPANVESVETQVEKWALAFCFREGDTVLSMASDEAKRDLIENGIWLGQESDNIGWSSPWPWGDEVDIIGQGMDYKILEVTDSQATILYYAWASEPHVWTWRETLQYHVEDGELVIDSEQIEMPDAIATLEEYLRMYPDYSFSDTPMNYATNGAGEILNRNASQSSHESYMKLYAPETAVVYLLNLSEDANKVQAVAGEKLENGNVPVTVTFLESGEKIYLIAAQPYGEDGIWIVQEADRDDFGSDGASAQQIEKPVIKIDANVLAGNVDAALEELRALYPEYEIVTEKSEAYYWNEETDGPAPVLYMTGEMDSLIESGRVADITELLSERGWLQQMDEAAKVTVSDVRGRVYGVPSTTFYAFGIMANVTLFEEAGLVDESGAPVMPATLEELTETAVAIKNVTGQPGLCIIAGTDSYVGVSHFQNIAWNFGAEFMTLEDGSYKTHLDSDEAIAAMQYMKDLKWKYNVLTEDPTKEGYTAGYEHLANGTAAMCFGANDALAMPAAYGMDSSKLAMGAMPAGPNGEQYSYSPDSAYVFSADATPEEMEVALSLLEILGQGPVANDAAKTRIQSKVQNSVEYGGPAVREIPVWNNAELLQYEQSMIEETGTTNQAFYQSYFDSVLVPGNRKHEVTIANSELHEELADVLKQVFTNPDADVAQLMQIANENWQKAVDIYATEYAF